MTFTHSESYRRMWRTRVVAVLIAVAIGSSTASAQPVFRRGRGAVFAPGGVIIADIERKSMSEEPFAGAASLETDSEIERLLRRAEQYISDQRYDLAAVLAQKVLDGPSSLLVQRSDDNFQWYTSTRAAVEILLAKLPPEALTAYRLTADAEAKGLLATEGDGREAALADIVRRYFISSLGDDAAFELGCRLMDRHDFVGASRLFDHLLRDHPDPSISRDQVLLRQAAASARLGDSRQAAAILADLDKRPATAELRELLALVRQDVKRANSLAHLATSSKDSWPMRLGTPSRDGVMPALTQDVLSGPMVADPAWKTKSFALPVQPVAGMAVPGPIPGGASVAASMDRESLVNRWVDRRWMSTTEVLLHDGRLYLKNYSSAVSTGSTPEELISSYSTETGGLAFETRPGPSQIDVISQFLMRAGMPAGPMADLPLRFEEVMLFGDRTNHLLAIIDGVLYVIEGSPGTTEADQQLLMRQGIPAVGSSRNRLSAFWDPSHPTNPSEGKIKWSDEGNEWMANVRFAGAPVPCGGNVVVPGREGSGLFLYAVSPADGSLVWKSFLCDEPRGGISRWAPVGLAVDGDELYVASGSGVVFTVDGTSGGVRWAVQYRRSGSQYYVSHQFPVRQLTGLSLKGWDENTVIPRGRALIVLPSDAEQIYAFDRRTGDLLWDSPQATPDGGTARYCLGVAGDSLFVAGSDVVRRIKVLGGSIVWEQGREQGIDVSYGRGALTEKAIYVPVKDSILQLDLESGRHAAQVIVTLPDNDKVGNLLCDGRRLYVMGMDRLHALAYADQVEPPAEEPAEDSSTSAVGEAAPASSSEDGEKLNQSDADVPSEAISR